MAFTYKDPEGKVWTIRPPLMAVPASPLLHGVREDGVPVALHQSLIQGYMPNVPFHKSERMFRRYEDQIKVIIDNLPDKAVAFSPGQFSVQTALCRLRDSISSVLEYRWETQLDLLKLAQIRPQIEFTTQEGLVIVRRRGSKDLDQSQMVSETISGPGQFGFILDAPDTELLEAVALLHGRRLLDKPTKIYNVPRSVFDSIAARHDVAISEDVDHFVMF